MKSLIKIGLSITLIGCASLPPSFRFDGSDGAYHLEGDMYSSSYSQLIEILNANKNKKVRIVARSNGGKVAGVELAMDAIRAHGQVYWEVPGYSKCYSACALLALSASRIDGTLYFHSIYSSYKDMTYKLVARNNVIRARLISYGYDEALVDRFFSSINIYTKLKFVDGVLEEVR